MPLDWKKEGDYDYLNDLSLSGLAFEFLRRNPEYIADYEAYVEIRERVSNSKAGPKKSGGHPFLDKPAPHLIYDPPWLPSESLADWKEKAFASKTEPKRSHFKDWYRKNWGIISEDLPDPSRRLSKPFKLELTDSFPLEPTLEEIGEYFHGDIDGTYEDESDVEDADGDIDESENFKPWSQLPNYSVLVFDLELPLKSQLQSARELLKKKQTALKKNSKYTFVSEHKTGNFRTVLKRYIRLLDADRANADSESIRVILMGDSPTMPNPNYGYDKVSDNRMRALKFRDKQYRAIPTWKSDSD